MSSISLSTESRGTFNIGGKSTTIAEGATKAVVDGHKTYSATLPFAPLGVPQVGVTTHSTDTVLLDAEGQKQLGAISDFAKAHNVTGFHTGVTPGSYVSYEFGNSGLFESSAKTGGAAFADAGKAVHSLMGKLGMLHI